MTDQTPPYHYQVIRRAIEILDASDGRVALADLAAQMGMSAAHFQRVFSAWVGVSPKRYQQYLTLDHAKQMLAARHTTLETAHQAGLSGAGRLHDLFITWEAMSPGDFAKRGAGLRIGYEYCDTPFGEALVMATDRGICAIAFAEEIGRQAAFVDLSSRWPAADFVRDPAVATYAAAAFGGTGRVHMMGAPFQIKVWEALLSIPSGHVSTYSDVAAIAGMPRAVRAVSTAIGRNPISWLIPCHRALRKGGALGGYHWGMGVKRAMLAYEAARTEL